MDRLDQYRRAMAEFDHRVKVFTEERWHAGTPCEGWDARDLVNHVVVEQLWAPHLLAGETLEDVGDRYDGDQLGEDPVGVWLDASGDARDAFTTEGALDGTVHTSMGPMPATEYCDQMTLDLAIHAWDLARAISLDEVLDPELVEELYRIWAPRQPELTATGAFGTPVDVPASADAQTRLLAMLGRDPGRLRGAQGG